MTASISPWHDAYDKLKRFTRTSATPVEVLEFAGLLGRRLPRPITPEQWAQFAAVEALMKADELAGTPVPKELLLPPGVERPTT